ANATGSQKDNLNNSLKECDRVLRSLGRNTLDTFKALAAQPGKVKEVAEDLAAEARQAVDNADAALMNRPDVPDPRQNLPRSARTSEEATAFSKAWSAVMKETREAVAAEAASSSGQRQTELYRVVTNCNNQVAALKKYGEDSAVLPA